MPEPAISSIFLQKAVTEYNFIKSIRDNPFYIGERTRNYLPYPHFPGYFPNFPAQHFAQLAVFAHSSADIVNIGVLQSLNRSLISRSRSLCSDKN
jgi:hypothetical protein